MFTSSSNKVGKNILFVTSKKMKLRIHQFTNLKYWKKASKHFIMVYFILFLTLKNNLSLAFSFQRLSKTFCSTLNWWIRGFVFLISRTGYITLKLVIVITNIQKIWERIRNVTQSKYREFFSYISSAKILHVMG